MNQGNFAGQLGLVPSASVSTEQGTDMEALGEILLFQNSSQESHKKWYNFEILFHWKKGISSDYFLITCSKIFQFNIAKSLQAQDISA